MWLLLLLSLLIFFLALHLYVHIKTYKMARFSEKISGPKPWPIIGNAFDVAGLNCNTQEFFHNVISLQKKYGPLLRVWMGSDLYILISSAKGSEAILGSLKILDKSINYRHLTPWLGTGLLTSTGEKWKKHRKIITPTFHFKLLEEFLNVFNGSGNKMVQQLRYKANGKEFDIYPYIRLCTLNMICETAMGINICVHDKTDFQYFQAVRQMADSIVRRSIRPWLDYNCLFKLSNIYKIQKKALAILNSMTKKVVADKKEEYMKKDELNNNFEVNVDSMDKRRRKVFLDLLLEAVGANLLTDEELMEEVETFMFEGHDTTTSAISFALSNLALYPHIQEKVYEEQENIFGTSNRDATCQDIHEMKYLEMVIKETLRLYPSVPMFGRKLNQDLQIDGYTLPKGANVILFSYMIHRDPSVYTEPESFIPLRFSPENSKHRSPYQYIPFSAGPRNCVGQKFAMLEMKCTVSKIIRNFKLLPGSTTNKLEELSNELVLKNVRGVNIKLVNRRKEENEGHILFSNNILI